MIRRAFIALSLLLGGCAHTAVSVNSGTAHGTSVVSSGGALHVHASGGAAAAIVIGATVIGSTAGGGEPSFSEWFWQPPAPAMDPTRSVSEQDCAKPIAGSGNLRCR